MNATTAFVGDIHGNLTALQELYDALATHGAAHTVFLGDYINKGPQSAEVMRELLAYSKAGTATLLKGNHETALFDALETGDITDFLKMGGAVTIRSYVGTKVGPDVLEEFRAKLPISHLDAISRMPERYESDDVIAQHGPPASSTPKFRISAHIPIGKLPRVGHRSAQIDTGSGVESGRLTALLWPSLEYIQVDASGEIVTS